MRFVHWTFAKYVSRMCAADDRFVLNLSKNRQINDVSAKIQQTICICST